MAEVTWNPDDKNSNIALSNSNLTATASANANGIVRATGSKTAGKFYFEVTIANFVSSQAVAIGVATPSESLTNSLLASNSWGYWDDGTVWHGFADSSTGVPFTTDDVVGVAVDMDAGKLWWSKNGAWLQGGDPATGSTPKYSNLAGNTIFPAASVTSTNNAVTANFGGPFSYPIPSGFSSWGDPPPAPSFTGALATILQPALTSINGTFTVYAVTGLVKEQGTPVSRVVRVYRRDTGAFMGETTSAGDGTFTLYLGNYSGEVYVIALDDIGTTPDFNASIKDRIVPVLQ